MCNRCRHRLILSNVMEGLVTGLDDYLTVLATNPDADDVSGSSNGKAWTVEERELTFKGVRAAAQLLDNFWSNSDSEEDVKLMLALTPEERSEALDFFALLYNTTISVSNAVIKAKALKKDTDRPEALAGAMAMIEGGPASGLRAMFKELLKRNAAADINPLGAPPPDGGRLN